MLGTWVTSVLCLGAVCLGILVFALAGGVVPAIGAGIVLWGLGFAAANSMQQARLVAAAPALSSATVALNTSFVYVGQAIGSALGGILFTAGYLHAIGFAGVAFVVASIAMWAVTRDRDSIKA